MTELTSSISPPQEIKVESGEERKPLPAPGPGKKRRRKKKKKKAPAAQLDAETGGGIRAPAEPKGKSHVATKSPNFPSQKQPPRLKPVVQGGNSQSRSSSVAGSDEYDQSSMSDDASDHEDSEDYRPGGYHPITVGDEFHDHKYQVVKKLGWGHFSTVWMVRTKPLSREEPSDKTHVLPGSEWRGECVEKMASQGSEVLKQGSSTITEDLSTGALSIQLVAGDTPQVMQKNNPEEGSGEDAKFLALKVQKSGGQYNEAALDEIKLFKCVSAAAQKKNGLSQCPNIVSLVDSFRHTGPHGDHMCMIFEVLGPNLLSLIKRYHYQGLPIKVVKHVVRHVCRGLQFLHDECQIIHTDLKPENILLQPNDTSPHLLGDSMTPPSSSCLPAETPRAQSRSTKQDRKLSPTSSHSDVQSEMRTTEGTAHAVNGTKGDATAVEQLTSRLEEADLMKSHMTSAERRKLKKKLKKKRQKKNKQSSQCNNNSNNNNNNNKSSNNNNDSQCHPEGRVIEEESDGHKGKDAEVAQMLSQGASQEQQTHESARHARGESTDHGENKQKGPTESSQSQRRPADLQNTNKNSEPGAGAERSKSSSSFLDDETKVCDARVVIIDLGNACWTYKHFTEDIQTRQYRSPEVILGAPYDTSADIWSLACMIFELLTGDLLFDPHSGDNYTRDEDHLAHCAELLGKIPKKVALGGKYSKEFYTRKGELRHIRKFKYWALVDVLHDKYEFTQSEAADIAGFMRPMLAYQPSRRATAKSCLESQWLTE
mmetsp:Transcript_19763/g.26813  ORF Transcript_19763/g.26813 Transcript_19763/m.26813 type:complete len:766 (-) Transcript_19763:394-2691(-)